jgi:hypothetical protein
MQKKAIALVLNMLVLSATLLLTLGVVEFLLRNFMPIDYRRPASELPQVAREIIYQAADVPGLDYELVPGVDTEAHGVSVTTNSYGMRGPEPDPTRPEKIIVLGDSFTFGFGVQQDEIFPAVMQTELAATDFDILNLAVSGYATHHEAAALKYKGLIWAPDVIIVGYVLNDPETEPIQQLPAYFATPEWWQYSHVLRLVARGAKRISMLAYGGGNYYNYLHANPATWQSVVDGFGDITAMVDPESRVIVVIFPDLWHDWDAYPYSDLHAQVTREAQLHDFEVIDLRQKYETYAPAELRVSGVDGHPNWLAHELAAEAILDQLR